MTTPPHRLLIILAAAFLLVACSDDNTASTPDAAADAEFDGAPDVMEDSGDVDTPDVEDIGEDIITIGEVGSPDQGSGCDPRTLADAWPWNDAVTTGNIVVSEDGGVYSATIDAAAGGMNASRNNPFVYLDLSGAIRVDITDIEALEDTTWDLAFKRVLIRTNSDDSGPGQVSLAKVANTTFDDVTSAPTSAAAYATDVSLDQECELIPDPIGNPWAAINTLNINNPTGSRSWYDYGAGITPHEGDIYIIRNDAEDATYKLEIFSWESGVYRVQWAEL